MEAQDREIDALNKQLAPFRLLKGVEVNIRADGSLDVPDEVLAERDWVVASIHSAFHRDPTERLLRRDGEPARRLHRPPDRAEDRPPGGHVAIDPGRVIETAASNRYGARDQLPARPAGHAGPAGAAARARPASSCP